MQEVEAESVTCSSEDKDFPASNLLGITKRCGDERKWLTRKMGESLVYVIFSYKEPFVIGSIEITNEGSSCIQVDVAQKKSPNAFRPLLRMQHFMSQTESHNSINRNGVRKFERLNMVQPAASEKWDKIKILCAQPFNKSVKYGLSRVVVCAADVTISPQTSANLSMQGSLNMEGKKKDVRSDSRQSSLIFPSPNKPEMMEAADTVCVRVRGKEFHPPSVTGEQSSRQHLPANLNLSDSGTMRNTAAGVGIISSLPTIKKESDDSSDESDESDVESDESDVESDEADDIIVLGEERSMLQDDGKRKVSSHSLSSHLNVPLPSQDTSATSPVRPVLTAPCKREHSPDRSAECSSKRINQSRILYKPFNKLLEGVEIVISGFINPTRAEIRNRALKMGAKYSPFWTETSTHLICAFLYTPKYMQAKDEGLIVQREWVDECFTQRKRLPWQRFALNPWERRVPSNEDSEIWELIPESGAASSSGAITINDTHCSSDPTAANTDISHTGTIQIKTETEKDRDTDTRPSPYKRFVKEEPVNLEQPEEDCIQDQSEANRSALDINGRPCVSGSTATNTDISHTGMIQIKRETQNVMDIETSSSPWKRLVKEEPVHLREPDDDCIQDGKAANSCDRSHPQMVGSQDFGFAGYYRPDMLIAGGSSSYYSSGMVLVPEAGSYSPVGPVLWARGVPAMVPTFPPVPLQVMIPAQVVENGAQDPHNQRPAAAGQEKSSHLSQNMQ